MRASRLFTILLVSFLLTANANSLKAQMITHVPLYTFHGDSADDAFGASVSGAGDVDGDGTPDLIIGAFNDENNGFRSGSARVLSGSDGSVLYNFDGDINDSFGASVGGAGDVNGDGRADLIVGAPGNGIGSARTRVFSGSDGSLLYNFDGDGSFGVSVSGAGDVNGDGRADLIIGTDNDDNNGSLSGSARVLSGSDGSVLYNFDGDIAGDRFGISVSGAGDVNGDGRADLIVGAWGNGPARGKARVLSGSDGSVLYNFDGDSPFERFGTSVSGAGDVNGDGFPDLIVGAFNDDNNGSTSGSARVLSGSDGSVLYNFDGRSVNGRFGSSVSGAGDVNGDGFTDLIIGAPFEHDNGSTFGSARVLSGSDGSILYAFNGDSAADQFGNSVSCAGDINGDGVDDFIVGAQNGGASGGGYARVFVSQILGDCNQDGAVNFSDISPFITILAADDFLGQADTNEDGAVTFDDIAPFIVLLSL